MGTEMNGHHEETSYGQREVFILRLWRRTPHGLAWQGQVQQVSSGESVYVKSPEELLAYLQERMQGYTGPAPEKQGLK